MERRGSIILCGFMGCGKSTVGKRLAKETGRVFLDLDSYIEQQAGMTVSQIFAAEGEAGFRARETAAAREIAGRGDLVVAAGGGTVLFEENVSALRRGGGTIVLLSVPLGILQQRLKNDTKRPLLQVPDRHALIETLYRQRMPLYRRAADVEIRALSSPRKLSLEIMERLGLAAPDAEKPK